MRRMLGLMLALAMASGAPVAAQEHDGGHDMHRMSGEASTHGMPDSAAAMLSMLRERLELTDEQAAAAMPYITAMHTAAMKAHELKEGTEGEARDEATRERLEKLHTEVMTNMKAFADLLTEEQRTTFMELHHEMREHSEHEMRHDGDGMHDEAEHGDRHDGDGDHDGGK